MHEEDEGPPNEIAHAYHFSITNNRCEFCLLTPSAILAFPKCLFKGWRLDIRGFICLKPRSYAQYTPGANIHPGCKFAPGVYFGHVNGAL